MPLVGVLHAWNSTKQRSNGGAIALTRSDMSSGRGSCSHYAATWSADDRAPSSSAGFVAQHGANWDHGKLGGVY